MSQAVTQEDFLWGGGVVLFMINRQNVIECI